MSRPWEPELVLSVDEALGVVVAQFPEFAGAEARPYGNGWDNTAVLVGDVVFRFARRPIAVGLLETEARVLPALAPLLPLPVPVPRWLGRIPDPSWPFLGYRRLAGEPLTDRPLPEPALSSSAERLGAFLRVLHSLDPDLLRLPPDPVNRLELRPRLPQLRERLGSLAQAGLIEAADPFLELFEEPLPEVGDVRVPVHGDLYGRHLLADDRGELCGVIDWGDVHAGDPASDLSIYWSLFPPSLRPRFLAAYGAVDERTLRLARLRAVFHSASVALYAYAEGDAALLRGGLNALENVLAVEATLAPERPGAQG